MRELKAFIQTSAVDTVVRALQKAGAPGITISHIRGVGYDYDAMQFTFAPGVEGKAPELVKIEIVCRKEDAERFTAVIVQTAGSGRRGDGLVFILPVEAAVKVRTGEAGPGALST
jgi:nitrogen regulatory protein P-II 1